MDEFSKGELLSNEKASLGFYLSSHPTTIYKSSISNVINLVDIKNVGIVTCKDIINSRGDGFSISMIAFLKYYLGM